MPVSSDNLVRWIEEIAEGEPIEGVLIGEMGWRGYGSEKVPTWKQQPSDKLISWTEARVLLDYEFDSGYGSPSCNAICVWTPSICVWTPSKVIGISQYDGATNWFWFLRNPIDHTPEMPGGG